MDFLTNDNHYNNCNNLQDYIFKLINFLKKEEVIFEEEVLMIHNEEVIEHSYEDTQYNRNSILIINEDINDYVLECAIDSLHEDIKKIEDFLEIVVE